MSNVEKIRDLISSIFTSNEVISYESIENILVTNGYSCKSRNLRDNGRQYKHISFNVDKLIFQVYEDVMEVFDDKVSIYSLRNNIVIFKSDSSGTICICNNGDKKYYKQPSYIHKYSKYNGCIYVDAYWSLYNIIVDDELREKISACKGFNFRSYHGLSDATKMYINYCRKFPHAVYKMDKYYVIIMNDYVAYLIDNLVYYLGTIHYYGDDYNMRLTINGIYTNHVAIDEYDNYGSCYIDELNSILKNYGMDYVYKLALRKIGF